MWIKPITDRTWEDVEYAIANANDAEHLKGALDYVAWRRISGNIAHLSQYSGYFPALRINWPSPFENQDGSNGLNWPTETDAANLMKDLTALRSKYAPLIPELPDYPTLHYEVFNLIESIINDLERLYRQNSEAVNYVGEIYVGDEIGVL